MEAVIYGLRWCVQQGFQHVILEVDSELLSKWVSHQMKPPWDLHNFNQWLVEITRVFHSFTCIHAYRKVNFTADVLSKHSHTLTSPGHYTATRQLPHDVKGYYKLDKIGLASLRRMKTIRIKKPP
ncbi:hypothetical protein KY285_031292 [Solanum tuberosum]|nr:hypothetical protein KY284_031091 [Solanum tuberosum]KAH0656410.1 hypothetical protein KY285_031292 [Solanum tuberosum]